MYYILLVNQNNKVLFLFYLGSEKTKLIEKGITFSNRPGKEANFDIRHIVVGLKMPEK